MKRFRSLNCLRFCILTFLWVTGFSGFAVSQQNPDERKDANFEVVHSRTSGGYGIGSRLIYVYLPESEFNRNTLRRLFSQFSKENAIGPLRVTVFTNRAQLDLLIKAESQAVPHFSATQQGEKSREAYVAKNYPPEIGYFRAFYERNDVREFYYYSIRPDQSNMATVILRDKEVFVNSPDRLFYYVKMGYLDAVKWILKQKQDLAMRDSSGLTPLIWAVALQQDEVAKELINAGANVNEKSEKGIPVLLYAADSFNYEGVRLLLDSGAKVNQTSIDGKTALMAAAFSCNPAIAKLLIDNGASQSIKDLDGKTAASYACSDQRIISLLKQ